MNETVRKYLIRQSKKRKSVGYSEINIECNLNLDFNLQSSRTEIGKILGEISVYEFNKNRPLLSSIVIYKSDKLGIGLGNGFYGLAEELGFGNKNKLKSIDFAEVEMKKTFDFWAIKKEQHITFFTKSDLDHFQEIAGNIYRTERKLSQEQAEIIKPIYEKSNYWGEQLKLNGFLLNMIIDGKVVDTSKLIPGAEFIENKTRGN